MKNRETKTLTCSFCGKTTKELSKMVSGEDVRICGECIEVCLDIIGNDTTSSEKRTPLQQMYPKIIKEFLDEHIIGQDRAKKTLSVAVYNHYKRVRSELFKEESTDKADEETKTDSEAQEKGHFKTELTGISSLEEEPEQNQEDDEYVELTKGNILMIGPTGCGKTLMARTLAKKLDVPFTIADATSLTEAGYVGEDVENIMKNLWIAADRNVESASRGIVCIDEVDKLGTRRAGSSSNRDVGGEGVQQALLKMVESSEVSISPDGTKNQPQSSLITIDTTNVLFICCGSFQGLTDLIARRLGKSKVGFGNGEKEEQKLDQNNILSKVEPKDLNQFGLIPEFIGRFPVIVTFDQLEEKQLVEILWKPKNSLIAQYQKLFRIEGVKLQFRHEALVAMVQKAIHRGTGARGLRSIIEEVMLDIMYEIPSLEGVTECIITKGCVTERQQPHLIYGKKIA